MTGRFNISVKNALLLTAWVAAWCANFSAVDWYEEQAGDSELFVYALYFSLLIVPPAAVVGILCGHQRIGIFCGLASSVAFILAVSGLLNFFVPL